MLDVKVVGILLLIVFKNTVEKGLIIFSKKLLGYCIKLLNNS